MSEINLTLTGPEPPRTFSSFRDPLGKVFLDGRDVWRLVDARSVPEFREFLDLRLASEWQQKERIIETRPAQTSELDSFNERFGTVGENFALFKHKRVEFPSFPYEWPAEMLYAAGKFTLELADVFFQGTGWSLKDASPYNVLFDGTRPVFVDLLSFERRNQKDPLWLPYNQFVQTFVLPLLINRELGITLRSIFLTEREGVPVAEAAKLFRGLKRLKPRIFSLVTLPHLLAARAERSQTLYRPTQLDSAERARFILRQSFRRLYRQLEKLTPTRKQESNWSGYTEFNRETIPEYMQAKQDFLEKSLADLRPSRVLDIGCNTGFFSLMAARSGARVVAIDYDEAAVGQVFRGAKSEGLNVLPLVVNMSRPTPRLGWRLSENPSFLDRAMGRFDLVMMLAVAHHMLVTERVPLREIVRLAAALSSRNLIIEYVPPEDRMFQSLLRGRDHLHQDLTSEKFLDTVSEFFRPIRYRKLPQSERQIFLLEKK